MLHTLVDCNDNLSPKKYFSVTLGTITLLQGCPFMPDDFIDKESINIIIKLFNKTKLWCRHSRCNNETDKPAQGTAPYIYMAAEI